MFRSVRSAEHRGLSYNGFDDLTWIRTTWRGGTKTTVRTGLVLTIESYHVMAPKPSTRPKVKAVKPDLLPLRSSFSALPDELRAIG